MRVLRGHQAKLSQFFPLLHICHICKPSPGSRSYPKGDAKESRACPLLGSKPSSSFLALLLEPNKSTKTPKACIIWVLLQPNFLPLSFLSQWFLPWVCLLIRPKVSGVLPLLLHILTLLLCLCLCLNVTSSERPSLTTLYKIAPQQPHTTHRACTLLLHSMSLTFYSAFI